MTARETTEPGVATQHNGDADRRSLDVSRFGGGVASDSQHTALRASVRQLGQLLGEALTRHEGADLLALVEEVRAKAREPGDEALHRLLAGVDDATAVVLARAFTAYFQLVNVTEQLHRYQELTTGEEGPLEGTVRRIGEALKDGSVDRELVESVLARVEYRPVFTAHPTEATRRTVLTLLRKIADVVDASEDPRRPSLDRAQRDRRLAELVDLLWQTDELRIVRPQPTDEARTATYYLRSLATSVVPDLLEELDRQLATIDVTLPLDARPLRFGTWAGGRPRRQPQRHARGHSRRAQPAAPRRPPRAHRPGRGPAHRGCPPRPAWSPSPTRC